MNCEFIKVNPAAVIPTRVHDGDVGFDLTAISLIKYDSTNETYLCDTGLCIKPPDGYYTEIHGRSSLPKKGFVLANNVGIIDPSYRGNLLLLLRDIKNTRSPPTFPFTCCQLIFKKLEQIKLVQVYDLDETKRGIGGFGSTDK